MVFVTAAGAAAPRADRSERHPSGGILGRCEPECQVGLRDRSQDRMRGPSAHIEATGSADHSALAVAADNSLTVARVSEASSAVRILARTRSGSGTWGTIEAASQAPDWHSRYFGVHIDQGPSLLVGPDGVRYLTCVEDHGASGDDGVFDYPPSGRRGLGAGRGDAHQPVPPYAGLAGHSGPNTHPGLQGSGFAVSRTESGGEKEVADTSAQCLLRR